MENSLDRLGYETFGPVVSREKLDAVRERIFADGEAGTRCLLDDTRVGAIAVEARSTLVAADRLPEGAVAIQAIAFNKTAAANWKVTWHQDLMFPFAEPVQEEGFALPSVKDGVNYARPPVLVLDELLAVRIHLDACDAGNGPLRVSPGTHRRGI
ncbi:MAG TPA: phytanoyl-CoA dioxygenase family protein, partial [Opitutaceae bacterium]